MFPSNDNDKPGSPNDVVEIENPEKQSTTSIRRKRDRDGDIISTQQTSSTQNHRDGDNFLGYISELYGNLPKKELTGILCDYIRSIDDAVALEKCVMRSFKPYDIALTIKDLQEILRIDTRISVKCFNLGVRCRAYREYGRLTYYNNAISRHFMDLRFCAMCDLTRDPKFRKTHKGEELSVAIGAWDIMKYDHLRCKYFLLPWFTGKNFMLYMLDHMDKKLYVIDPSHIPSWCEGNAFRKYGKNLTHFSKSYMSAMNVQSSGWYEDIYKWSFRHEKEIVQDSEEGYSTGYLVL